MRRGTLGEARMVEGAEQRQVEKYGKRERNEVKGTLWFGRCRSTKEGNGRTGHCRRQKKYRCAARTENTNINVPAKRRMKQICRVEQREGERRREPEYHVFRDPGHGQKCCGLFLVHVFQFLDPS